MAFLGCQAGCLLITESESNESFKKSVESTRYTHPIRFTERAAERCPPSITDVRQPVHLSLRQYYLSRSDSNNLVDGTSPQSPAPSKFCLRLTSLLHLLHLDIARVPQINDLECRKLWENSACIIHGRETCGKQDVSPVFHRRETSGPHVVTELYSGMHSNFPGSFTNGKRLRNSTTAFG